jgi:hypothetical protein
MNYKQGTLQIFVVASMQDMSFHASIYYVVPPSHNTCPLHIPKDINGLYTFGSQKHHVSIATCHDYLTWFTNVFPMWSLKHPMPKT